MTRPLVRAGTGKARMKKQSLASQASSLLSVHMLAHAVVLVDTGAPPTDSDDYACVSAAHDHFGAEFTITRSCAINSPLARRLVRGIWAEPSARPRHLLGRVGSGRQHRRSAARQVCAVIAQRFLLPGQLDGQELLWRPGVAHQCLAARDSQAGPRAGDPDADWLRSRRHRLPAAARGSNAQSSPMNRGSSSSAGTESPADGTR